MNEVRLIDANALKEELARHEPTIIFNRNYDGLLADIIDNAPTVETDIEVVAKEAYKQGYTDGWKERFGEPNERPQGEWLLLKTNYEDSGNNFYECTNCHYTDIHADSAEVPYCWHCGAEMLKGGAE